MTLCSSPRIPDDILLHIFAHCQNDSGFITLPVSSMDDFPWVLMRVCSQWRSSITAFSNLWSTIKFDYAGNFYLKHAKFPFESPLQLEEHVLSSSRSSPLYISFFLGDCGMPIERHTLHKLITLIAQHGPRIEHLFIQGALAPTRFPSTLNFQNLNALKSLHVEEDPWTSRSLDQILLSLRTIAPNLARISLPHTIPYIFLLNEFHLENIVVLKIPKTVLSSDQMLAVLFQCTSLQELSIGVFDLEDQPTYPHDITMPHLKALALYRHEHWVGTVWASRVNMPVLQTYRVEATMSVHFGRSRQPFTAALPNVHHLDTLILDVCVDVTLIEHILEDASCLLTLELLQGEHLTDALLTRLSKDLAPSLKILKCIVALSDDEPQFFHGHRLDPLNSSKLYPNFAHEIPFSQLHAHLAMLEQRAASTKLATIDQFSIINPSWGPLVANRLEDSEVLASMLASGWKITVSDK